jgi:flagellin
MLTGAFAKDSAAGRVMQFHIGANMDQNARVYIGTMTAQALGLKGAAGTDEQLSVATPETANMAIGTVDNALLTVSKQRADLGAYQNRFEMASQGVAIAAENLQASESLIRDTDMASAMVEYTKNQILTQSGTAMLAQANSQPQSVLALLR